MIKNKKVYVRLIITYTLFLLIPLLLNVFTLNDIAAATQNNIYHSVLTDLEHAVKNLEDNLDEVDTLIENLTENMAVRNIALRMDEADKRVKHSWPSSVQSYMRSTNISKFWEEYYLFFRDSRMVISPEHIFYYDESVQYFFQYGDCSWEEWLEKLNESYFYYIFPEAETKQNFSSEKRFLYVQSLLLGAGVKGTFVFPINSETFKNMVEDAYIGHVGWAYLTDSEGRLLVSLPSDSGEFCVVPEEYESDAALQEITLDGRTVEVIRSRSEERGLELVALLPREYITTQIKQAQQRNLKLIMLAIAMGSISILAVSWLRGRKIDRILRVLSGSGIQEDNSIFKGDELVYISDSLTQLIADNAELQDNIRRQEPMTRELLLERLLRGNSIGVEKSLEQFGICVSGKQFLVIVYQINPIDEDEVIYLKENVICKQVLQKELGEIISGEKYTSDIDVNAGAIICAVKEYQTEERAQLLTKIEKICDRFMEKYGVDIQIAVGNMASDISQISKAFERASEMLQYGISSRQKVFDCADYFQDKEYYYYPVLLEEKLVNAVKSGNADRMREQLKEVYDVNIIECNISPFMMHFLINDLQCTVLKVLHSLSEDVQLDKEKIYAQLQQINEERNILIRFQRINDIFKAICENVRDKTIARSDRMKQTIEIYILSNYSNPDMCLKKAAEDFGYVSTYFSKLFKDLFHENFAAYLEQVRINRICELLEKGQTMENIAVQTGYGSVQVMRSAFKRVKGMTPNEYRQMKRKG